MRSCYRLPLRIALSFAMLLIALTALGLWANENDNFHAIIPGEAYRSAQLKPEELRHYLRKYKIKSVINLRGPMESEAWYRDELRVCAQERVSHYDLNLTAYKAPSENQIETLLYIFGTAPRPIIMHCQGGADRAGLAAAMWRVYIGGEDKRQASAELSWRYGHFPFGRKKVLDEFFTAWNPPAPTAAAGD